MIWDFCFLILQGFNTNQKSSLGVIWNGSIATPNDSTAINEFCNIIYISTLRLKFNTQFSCLREGWQSQFHLLIKTSFFISAVKKQFKKLCKVWTAVCVLLVGPYWLSLQCSVCWRMPATTTGCIVWYSSVSSKQIMIKDGTRIVHHRVTKRLNLKIPHIPMNFKVEATPYMMQAHLELTK